MYLDFSWILLGYSTENGTILQKEAQPGKYTKLTLKSDRDHEYTVKRHKGGGNVD